jgi:hypothetical protein
MAAGKIRPEDMDPEQLTKTARWLNKAQMRIKRHSIVPSPRNIKRCIETREQELMEHSGADAERISRQSRAGGSGDQNWSAAAATAWRGAATIAARAVHRALQEWNSYSRP